MTTIVKLCCYCHHNPRRPKSPYCSDRCANKKRAQNRRNQANKRAAERARRAAKKQDDIEAGRVIDERAVATLQEARAVLREPDAEPQRLTPRVVVTKWNIKKDKTYRVTI